MLWEFKTPRKGFTELRKQEAAVKTLSVKYPLS